MFHLVILICAAAVHPSACTREAALTVIDYPERQASDLACMRRAQMVAGATPLVRPGDYVRVLCERRAR